MKFIILDRDGVINYDSEHYIKSPEEWIAIPGSLEAIAHLKKAGYTVVVATNQSGIRRGLYTEAMLEKIHEKMQKNLQTLGGKIDAIFYCPHTPEDKCACRKPEPGLLKKIAEHYAINLTGIPFVGDSSRDLEAARAVGCQPLLVMTSNGKSLVESGYDLTGIPVYENLAAAVKMILKGEQR